MSLPSSLRFGKQPRAWRIANGVHLLPFDPDKPYNDLPLLLPKVELESKAVLRKAIAANKALAELKGVDERIFLNPKFLDLLRYRKSDMSKKSVFLDTFFRICPSRGHIRARTHMVLDNGKVFEELVKTFEECREPSWDGYGAQSVREETYHLAHQFLTALPLSIPVPSIGAEPDGQITVEWYRSPQRTLSVSISGIWV